MQNPAPVSSLPVLASRVHDLTTASTDDLRREIEHLRRGASAGWLDRVYQTTVTLSAAQGHIYSIKRNAGLGDPWSVAGVGFDALNKAAGVTLATVDESVEWDGIMPARISLRRIAVGYNPSGSIRVATVLVEILARHYRFERIRKAAATWDKGSMRPTPGFSFGTKLWLGDEGKLGGSHQVFLLTETLGDVPVGYALDLTQPKVREVLEDGSSFAKNLSRAATTIAGRLASKQWHGIEKIKPAWLYQDGADICARVPLVCWRSDLQRQQIEGIATEVAQGADINAALTSAGVRAERDITPILAETNPDPSDEEHEELAGEIIAQPDPTPAPALAAMHGDDLGLSDDEQREAVAEVTGEATRASVTPETLPGVRASMDRASIVDELKKQLRGYKAKIDGGDFGPDSFKEALARLGAEHGITTAGEIQRSSDETALANLCAAFATYCGEVP